MSSPIPYTSVHEVPVRKAPTGKRLALLSLTALGVVYGDIGTSPLYALRECFKKEYGIMPTPDNILGVLSLILWSLVLVVSFKYIVFILRADNRGEGGILALLALLLQQKRRDDDKKKRLALVALGLFGAALLYGDGVITPAVSVLSAVEGLNVNAPALAPFAMWISMVIIFALFMVQRFGTARVGTAFGPLMLAWFVTIAILGVRSVALTPSVLAAANPWHGVRFFAEHGMAGFLTLGAVVLCITGGEALYADMGHFGKRPIRVAWFLAVFPALLLNYFGQGALLLRQPEAASNPFYLMAPNAFQWPLLILATAAAVVASQALISGAFSLTQQSVQLGYSPRMQIIHTSVHEAGQIYIPEVNKALMVGCLVLVLGFKNSSNLSAAYGIAVTGTMAITTLLFAVIAGPVPGVVGGVVVLLAPFAYLDNRQRGRRPLVPGGEHRQDRARRMGTAGHGRGSIHADEHVETWTDPALGDPGAECTPVGDVSQEHRRKPAHARPGDCRVHDVQCGWRAGRDAAPSQA